MTEPKPTYQENEPIPLESFGVLTVQDGDVLIFKTQGKVSHNEISDFHHLVERIKAHTGKDVIFAVFDERIDLSVLRVQDERQTN